MPREIKSKEEFQKLLPSATEIRVVKGEEGGAAKIKLRTKDRLYTFVTTDTEIETFTKGTKTPVVEY